MKTLTPVFLVSLIAVLLVPAKASADGMFVVPRFVWDKHKDINEPTQKAILVYDAGHEDLILQVKYEGPVVEFGWLIPVPNLPTVQKGSMKCFYELSQYTQREFERGYFHDGDRAVSAGLGAEGAEVQSKPPVKVVESKTVGAYDIAVLSTEDSGALAKWLDANRFYFPPNKTGVLDFYVKQQWYFIAVKINLSKENGFQLLSPRQLENRTPSTYPTALKLTGGELNPLQISFDSDRCVFPLKISSINGKPSEVQVYVLSPEPLLEKTMLEKKLPLIYSNDVARAKESAEGIERTRLIERNYEMHLKGKTAPVNPSLSPEDKKEIQRISESLEVAPDELLHYAEVRQKDLPETSKWIPELADKSWWLTKQTWTFKPEEMDDLNFEPAILVLAEELGSKYDYFAERNLNSFWQSDIVPIIINTMQSTNPIIRAKLAGFIKKGAYSYHSDDPGLTEAAVIWLNDSEPNVRTAGVNVLTRHGYEWNPRFDKQFIAMLHDEDTGVRHAVVQAAVFGLPRSRDDLKAYIPIFQQMFKDKNPDIQASGLEMLHRMHVEIPRTELVPFFTSSDPDVLIAAYDQLRDQHEKISNDDALVLLHSQEPMGRFLGLEVVGQNPEKQSVELALPLLRDPEIRVRLAASATMRTLTDQHFNEDQADQWQAWWTANKTNFVFQVHPEE